MLLDEGRLSRLLNHDHARDRRADGAGGSAVGARPTRQMTGSDDRELARLGRVDIVRSLKRTLECRKGHIAALRANTAQPQIPKSPLDKSLTSRECQVLALLCEGLSNKEIGSCLEIADGTVRFYRRQIYAKLNVNRRSLMIAKARFIGLL